MAEIHSTALSGGGQVNTVRLVASGKHRATVVDVADNSTTVSAAPALLYGIFVNTVLSAHACPLLSSSTTILTLAASLAAGSIYWFDKGVPFDTSLIVDPNDAATGSITLIWAPQ